MQITKESMYAIVPRYGVEGVVEMLSVKVEYKPEDYVLNYNNHSE